MPKQCVLILIIALSCCSAIAQASGHISGIVLDENGQLVSDAKLCLMTKSGNHTGINCNLMHSDKSGDFNIANVKNGHYNIFAINEEEGYSIENQSPGQEVVLTSENIAPQVTLQVIAVEPQLRQAHDPVQVEPAVVPADVLL